jgi:two-component system sensor histidine kinase DegS
MSEDKSTSKNIIYNSNKEMLDYFNNLFLDDLENIQALKTQIFEIDIRIEELQKTKNIYAFKSSSRRSVFTPVAPEALLEDESNYIQEQIKTLEDEKQDLEIKLRTMERSVNNNKRRTCRGGRSSFLHYSYRFRRISVY